MSQQYKRVVALPHALVKSFENWKEVRFQYTASCYCTSIMTDMESYIEVEALEEDCLNELCKAFSALGFEEVKDEPNRLRVTRHRPDPQFLVQIFERHHFGDSLRDERIVLGFDGVKEYLSSLTYIDSVIEEVILEGMFQNTYDRIYVIPQNKDGSFDRVEE